MTSPCYKTKLVVIIALAITAFVCASAQTCVQPPDTTMVAWYSFDELLSTTSGDFASGNTGIQFGGPLGTISPPTQVGVAASFNGINQYVDSASSIANNFGPAATFPPCTPGTTSTCYGNFSIDTWIRIQPTVPAGVMAILDKRTGPPTLPLVGYHMYVFKFGAIQLFGLQLADNGTAPGLTNYSCPAVPNLYNGLWHHIAITVDRTSPTGITCYHNGGPLTPTLNPTNRSGSLANSSPLRIGARTAAQNLTGFFQGDLDELEIFNRVLTPTEVFNLFNAGTAGKVKPSNAWTINFGYAVSDAFSWVGGDIDRLDIVYWTLPGDHLGSLDMAFGSTSFGGTFNTYNVTSDTSLGVNCAGFEVHEASFVFLSVSVPPGQNYITLQNAVETQFGDPIYWEQSSGSSAAYSNGGNPDPLKCAQPSPDCPQNLIPPESFRVQ